VTASRSIRAGLVATLAAALLAVAASASADSGLATRATAVVVSGHGFGHGIGLSQWGADKRAAAGQNYRQILSFYYPGTTLGHMPGRTIRVLLAQGPLARIGSDAPFSLRDAHGVRVSVGAGRYSLSQDGRIGGRTLALPLLALPGATPLTLGATRYRGTLQIVRGSSGLDVINTLGLEDYVRDVVSSECPGYWPQQALRAQAVASRSYALANLHPERDFDVFPDDRSQNYHGLSKEFPTATAAAQATRYGVLLYGGRLVDAMFSASNGGMTSGAQDVFGSVALPYLVARPDAFDTNNPASSWGPVRIDLSRLRAAFASIPDPLIGVQVNSNEAGRAGTVTFTGSDGTVFRVDGRTFQVRLGLRSTMLSLDLSFQAPPASA
jgi:stage II sporulation protein D